MEYITHKRARFRSASGPVNIPFGSVLRVEGDFLYWNDLPICAITSENAYTYFARNDDGEGLVRGALTDAIERRLVLNQGNDYREHRRRWDKVWNDPTCQKYKRPEHEDHWIWSFDFYNAPIEDLRHIAALIQAKVKR